MKRFAIGLTLLFFATVTQAGNRVGNGGDVVICKEGKEKIELLDFYERGGMDFGNGFKSTDSSASAVTEEVFKRLERVAPKLSAQYKKRWQKMQDEIDFKQDVTLTDVKDSLHAQVPKGCQLQQIALRIADPHPGEKRFLVDKDTYDKMNKPQQSGLLVHEVVYEHFNKIGETNSRKARRLVGLLYSDEITKMTTGQFWKFIHQLEVPIYPD